MPQNKILTPAEYCKAIAEKKQYNEYLNEFTDWFNNELKSKINMGVATIRSVELFDIPDKFIAKDRDNDGRLVFTNDIVNYLNDNGWAIRKFEVNSDYPFQKNLIQLVAK